jgi:hypothetical protein
MGEGTRGLELSSHDGRKVELASADDAVGQLGADIAALREDLGGLVAELDRRRHALLDVRLQARRHAGGAAVAAVSLIGAAGGVVWLGMWRARRRQTPVARATRLQEAVERMIDQPERVATEQSVLEKIVTAAATAGVATIMNRILGTALERFIDRYFQPGRRDRPRAPVARIA